VLEKRGFLKKMSIVLLCALFVLPLAGCGKKKTTTSQTATKTTLTIWRAADNDESFADLIKNYRQDNPNVTINYVFKPEWKTNPDLYRQEAIDALATGRGPDIWSVRNDWLPTDHYKLRPMTDGLMASLSKNKDDQKASNAKLVQGQFVPVVLKDVIYECGVNTQSFNIDTIKSANVDQCPIYGLPLSVDSLGLYINKDIMKNASDALNDTNKLTKSLSTEEVKAIQAILNNGPKTWSEVVKIVPFLTITDGATITRSAIAMGLGSNIEQAPNIISTLLLQNGTDKIVTDDLKAANFQNAKGGEIKNAYPGQGAIKFYTYFAQPTLGGKPNSLYTWSSSFATQGARQAFVDGNLAMIIENSSFWASLKASNVKFAPSIINMPQLDPAVPARSYSTYWVESVTNNSKSADVAWDFIAYATGKGVRPYLSNTKRPPALTSSAGEYDTDASQQAVFQGQALIADSWYKGPDANQTDTIFRRWADDIALNGKAVAEATNTAASELTTLLQSTATPLGDTTTTANTSANASSSSN
jgi:ABC-type glycerol-3-phosphate transport system substrate-binding protein